MAAKRIRCICGKIYDPEESKVCPSCGTEVRVESISVIAPEAAPAPATAAPVAAGATPGAPRRRVPRVWIVAGACLVAVITALAWHLVQPDPKTIVPDHGSSGASADLSAAGKTESKESDKSKAARVFADEKTSVVKKEEAPPSGPSSGSGPASKQWIVEAGETEEAGGAALVKALGNAVQGDTVLLKPGTYAGEFTVGDGIRLVGETGGAGLPVIKMASKRTLIEVNPPGATLENLKIVFASEGSTPGLQVAPGTKLVIAGCEVQATAGNCIMGLPTSSITATKSVFTSRGGAAVQLVRASGKFDGCSFLKSRIGFAAAGDSKVELNDCTFEQCGPKNVPQNGARAEEGYIVNATADGDTEGRMSFADCKFSGNTGGIHVARGVTSTLTKCVFSGNGFPADSSLFSRGLLAVSAGGKMLLTGVTFQGDRQGLGVYSDGVLEMTDCRLTGVGLKGSRKDISFTGNSIFARGKAAVVRLKQCEIADAPGGVAVFASDGGAIEAEACDIRNAAFFAVYAGTGRDEAPCRVKLKGGRIVSNRAGLKVATGGAGSVEGTEFRQNVSGIEIADAGTSATFSKVVLTESRDLGLLVHSRADVTLSDCTIDNNAGGGAQVGVAGKPESRADLMIESCRIGSNTGFDIKAGTQSRLTVKNCTWTTPGGRPLLAIEQQTITQFDPPLGGLAGGVVMPVKKAKQTASDDKDTPARPRPPQRVAPSRTPPPDPVGQAIDAINRLRRIIR